MSSPKGPCGTAGGTAKLDIGHPEGLVRDFIDTSIAPSTARVYASGQGDIYLSVRAQITPFTVNGGAVVLVCHTSSQ